jgi:phospholipase A1
MLLATGAATGAVNKALDLVLVAPESSRQDPVPAGSTAGVFVVLTNPGSAARSVPPLISLVLTSEDGRTMQVQARAAHGSPEQVQAGGFVKLAYGFDLPLQMAGLVQAMEKRSTNTVMFFTGPPVKTGVPEKTTAPGPVTAMLPKFQPFFVNFYPYKPVYFLFGADPGLQKTSFQISFKYKLFNFAKTEPGNGFKTAMDRIYLAYTQQSFWDLRSDSAPFEDSRYMPEVFYYDDDLGLNLPRLIGSGFQAGFQHESNGRGGINSRSTNYAYVQPSLIFKFTRHLHMLLAPKAWVYVRNDDDTNPDLADYRGYFDIESRIGDPEGFALGSHYRHGRRGGSWQFDLSYPLDQIPGFKGLLDLYIHAQYYTGYSEQLLEYNQKEDIFRLGFSLVR